MAKSMQKRSANGQIIAIEHPKPAKKAGKPVYSAAQKQAALVRMAGKKSSCAQISKDTGIPEATLYKWLRQQKQAKAAKATPARVVTKRITQAPEVKTMAVAKSRDMSAILFDFVGNLAMLAAEMRRRGL